MSTQGSSSGAQRARESFASILSYYQNHVPSEEAPEFVKRASSGEIQIGVAKGTVPSAEQGEELKKALKQAMETQDALTNLSAVEKEIMSQAANASLRKRSGAK
ncbi:hypothetical protein BGW36DRAFT_22301 [Talaromyces proteolyticus]|uniref:Uncharacterized protein n=1 Tax=Talaromyces proteolyticus TaxID=1131652 RepID=A0AAD4L1Z4_9EURO|nr:uncharacterized protein BGW36DRAFT_22301 [Talaromyces proteolyticus]KAH8706067.1 hypothetical protein BGW36DRAFT_22301 [Talaromyces proteolyticus]